MSHIYNIENYFRNLHDVECNQKYAKVYPYSLHLKAVAAQATLFKHHIPVDEPYYTGTWIALYGHDSIEDARLTYNDIVNLNVRLGLQHIGGLTLTQANDAFKYAAELIYMCTEIRGKNRAERHGEEYLRTLLTSPYSDGAVFVKLCDIIANVKFSLLMNSSMYTKYQQEWPPFKEELKNRFKAINYCELYPDMIILLDNLLKLY